MPSTSSAHTFAYVDCDIPAGVTLDDWRHRRVSDAAPRRRSVRVLRRLAGF